MAGTGASGGRNAKSPMAHVVSGTFRGDRHSGHEVPEAPKGVPEPPKTLTGDARDEWDRMVGRLQGLGTLSVVDDAALFQYCCLFAETEARVIRQREMDDQIKRIEASFSRPEVELTGAELSACVQAVAQLANQVGSYDAKIRQDRMALRQYLVEFGMTPAARSRVKVPVKPAQSKVEQFMAGKRA
jgi:phage terminase small subunit